MPRARGVSLALIAALAATGCTPERATRAEVEAVKSVAVVVVVPNELAAKYVGFTVFGNEFYTAPLSQPDFRTQLRERVEQAASGQCRWGVRALNAEDDRLWPPYRENILSGFFQPSMYTSAESTLKPIAGELSAALKSSGADGLIVVVPAYGAEPNTVFGDVSGVEESHNTGMGFHVHGRNDLRTFVWISAYLYRGAAMKVRSLGRIQGIEALPGLEFKQPWAQYDQNQQKLLVDSVGKLIDRSAPQFCES